MLIQALARIPAARRPVVDVVGGGPLERELRAMADAAGVGASLNFLGRRSSDWIASEGPRYQGFLAPYVICLDNDRDTGPVSVKEALAMGLPVVASRLMGLKESVQPSNGRHVEPGDAAELADAIVWLASLTDSQRLALGGAGRIHALVNFTLAAQARQITAAIHAAGQARIVPCAA